MFSASWDFELSPTLHLRSIWWSLEKLSIVTVVAGRGGHVGIQWVETMKLLSILREQDSLPPKKIWPQNVDRVKVGYTSGKKRPYFSLLNFDIQTFYLLLYIFNIVFLPPKIQWKSSLSEGDFLSWHGN